MRSKRNNCIVGDVTSSEKVDTEKIHDCLTQEIAHVDKIESGEPSLFCLDIF